MTLRRESHAFKGLAVSRSARVSALCLAHEKNGEQAIDRSRGGLTTKIHVLVDGLGNPVEVMLTPGQVHDLTCAEPLLEGVDPEASIGDKAYDADPLRDTLAQREIVAVIPPKANRCLHEFHAALCTALSPPFH